MLKKDQLRVRTGADKSIQPVYVRLNNYDLRKRATQVMEIYADHVGHTQGELEEALSRFVKGGGDLKINKGFVELASGFAEFESGAAGLAREVRAALFAEGARHFPVGLGDGPGRETILANVAARFARTPDEVERLMFSDLKEAQLLERFQAPDPVAFLSRYNLALAQGLIVHAVGLDLTLPDARPERLRQLFRYLKFFQLLFEERHTDKGMEVRIDGPMSVLKQTKGYGVKLATFLPALLLLEEFHLVADIRWKRRRYTFEVRPEDGLVSHYNPRGGWVPEELHALLARLQETAPAGLEVGEASRVISLGGRQVYVPDIEARRGGRTAWLEVLWPWKKLDWKRTYDLFARHAPENAFLCVSTKVVPKTFQQENADPRIIYYRATPLADRILKAIDSYLQQ